MQVLQNKQYKSYDKISRYARFPFYYNRIDNKYVYGLTGYLKNTTYYVLHKCRKFDTLDILALEYYNNPIYYWVIADFNRIQDPFEDLQEGKYIKIPNFSTIEFDIGNKV